MSKPAARSDNGDALIEERVQSPDHFVTTFNSGAWRDIGSAPDV